MNDYHKQCQEKTEEYLKSRGKTEALNWLLDRTQAIPLLKIEEETTSGCDKSANMYITNALSLISAATLLLLC